MASGVLKRIFSSDLRVKALSYLFLHPGEEFHVRGLAAVLGKAPGATGRELATLEQAGALRSRTVGNQRHYCVRTDFLIYQELRSILLKTTGAGEALRDALSRLDGVELAFIYGSFASGEAHASSDIDVMIVGDIGDRELAPVVARVEKRLRREVNYTVYSRSDAEKRRGRKGDFVHEVLSGPRIILIGHPDDGLFRAS